MAVATLERPKFITAFEGTPDSTGVIHGISLIQEGPALGHGSFVDSTALSQCKRLATGMGKVKCKMDHWSSVDAAVGYFENFRVKGKKLLADLTLFQNFDDRQLLLEMIDSIPESFGISIVFDIAKFETDPATGVENVRISKLYSADFVDMPAANRDGVFSAPVDSKKAGMANTIDPPAEGEPAPTEPTTETPPADTEAFTALNKKLDAITTSVAALAEIVKGITKPADPAAAAVPSVTAPASPIDTKALAAEIIGQIALQKHVTPTSPPVQAAPPADPAKPKTYAEAKKEAIGELTGLDRAIAAEKFDTQWNKKPAA